MENKKMTWVEVYKSNYTYQSEEAKELISLVKKNYQDFNYIPWAVIERLAYMQDPDMILEKCTNDKGGYVFTDSIEINQNNNGVVTSSVVMAHLVKCKCMFLGKTFIDVYPIQDGAHNSVKAYDQNLVNKALQRCLTRVLARATGLGVSLYETGVMNEGGDAVQIDEAPPKPSAPSVSVESTKPKVEFQNSSELEELVGLIKSLNKDVINDYFKPLNNSLMNKYGFVVSADDSIDTLKTNLSKIANISKLLSSLKKKLGVN